MLVTLKRADGRDILVGTREVVLVEPAAQDLPPDPQPDDWVSDITLTSGKTVQVVGSIYTLCWQLSR